MIDDQSDDTGELESPEVDSAEFEPAEFDSAEVESGAVIGEVGDDDLDENDNENDDVLVLEEVDTELVLPVWEPTGEARVDDALDLLSTLDVDDVHQHAEVYGRIHERLRETLSNADASAD